MATATITTMVDPTVYLEKMSAFSRQLREAGLIVSPQETADACQLMITMGLADRSQVKTMLRTVYAKSREEQASFDRVFENFFLTEDAMRAREKQRRQQQEELEKVNIGHNDTSFFIQVIIIAHFFNNCKKFLKKV